MGVFLFLLFVDLAERRIEKMKHKKTEEEIKEYNRRIEEVFRKHNLILKCVDVEENNDYIVIFPGEKQDMRRNETDIGVQQYKNNVRRFLAEKTGQVQADMLMETYKDDFEEFIEKKWSPATAALAMLSGY